MDSAHQKPPTLSSRISRDTAARAVDALLKWIRSQPKHQKEQLLEHDEIIHLVVTMRKIPPKARINPYYLPLVHPLHSLPDAAICLFVDDRAKSPVQPSDAEARIRSESIPVSEVISLSSLKTDYIPYESRRKLCGSYDLFFADRRIIHLLPRLIGKQFFKKKKHPLPINLSHKNWAEQLMKGCHSALLYMRTGTCCQLNIGRLSMGRDDIVDNVIAAVEGAVEKIPKGWANVRSVLIKSDESIGLPIYQALPEMGLKIDVFPKGEGNVVNSEVDADAGRSCDNTAADQPMGEVEKVGSSKKSGSEKSGSKKGKLHKVRYMDTGLDEEAVMLDLSGDTKGDDNEHSPGGDDAGHPSKSDDSDSYGKSKKNEKKRKQMSNTDKGSCIASSLPEADEFSGEKSQGKKKGEGKKLKTLQVQDKTSDEEHVKLIGEKSAGRNKKQQVQELKTKQPKEGTTDEEPDELVGEKSQGKKNREGKKLKRQHVEDETADEEPQSGIARKTKSKLKNNSEFDSSPVDSGLSVQKSKGRKKPEVSPQLAEEEVFNKTTITFDSAKKSKDKTKRLESKKQSEKKSKKSKV